MKKIYTLILKSIPMQLNKWCVNIRSSGFGSIAGGKVILNCLPPIRLLFLFFSLLFFGISCGGFQDIEKIEKIKPPPDIETSLPVEKVRSKAIPKKINVFKAKEARQRARDYAQIK